MTDATTPDLSFDKSGTYDDQTDWLTYLEVGVDDAAKGRGIVQVRVTSSATYGKQEISVRLTAPMARAFARRMILAADEVDPDR